MESEIPIIYCRFPSYSIISTICARNFDYMSRFLTQIDLGCGPNLTQISHYGKE